MHINGFRFKRGHSFTLVKNENDVKSISILRRSQTPVGSEMSRAILINKCQ